jgi:DNA-binding transcriptional MerR regulator
MSSMLKVGVDSRVKTPVRLSMADRLSIGTVANRAGVTPDTIRYYERLGLLPKPARTPAGYREYGDGILNRLTLIRNAQQFGFSLREIGSFLRVRETGGAPCHDVRRAAARMLEAVDEQIADLVATRAQMQQTLRVWDTKLAGAGDARPAYLLETLGSSDRARRAGRAGLTKGLAGQTPAHRPSAIKSPRR